MSSQSAQVASWVRQVLQVRQEALPEIGGETTIKPITELRGYLKSTPWYLRGGYESSDEDMATESVVTTENQSTKKKKEPPKFNISRDEVVTILSDRNVNPSPSADGNMNWIMDNILGNLGESCGADEEHNWKKDLSKSQVSDEAIFQRTIMMDLINRHHLTSTLDYTCESVWKCPPTIPHRDIELAKRMPMPKPDLAVAFHANSLIAWFQRQDLKQWRSVMCPESSKEDKRDRAFHFLSIEVKGAQGTNANWIAHRQNFNTASHALNNIWFFMDKAGKEMVEAFYKTVRFYSVVATGKVFHIRVHRAIELEKGRIDKSYPLGFMFDVIHNHEGEYTKAEATGIIRNILVEYGIKTLQPLLNEALEKVWDSLQTPSEQNGAPEGAAASDGAANEAEQHRTTGRATSRQRQEASTSRQKRKRPSVQPQDTSFVRKDLDQLTVADGSSPSSGSRTPR